ncbi:MAG: ABC transporter permease [Planctomycetes bacterium]|nr:ABC transporter permease [Planctomycetota bacterium]
MVSRPSEPNGVAAFLASIPIVGMIYRRIAAMNAWFENACDGAGHALDLLAHSLRALASAHKKTDAIVLQTYKAVFGSLVIVFLTALFSGMILALQTGIELQRYNQESSIGYLVPVAMFREMGPVMTAISLAGLIGATYAAELGTMKVSEELDALEVMSIDPVYFLAMPRMIALSLSATALTLIANIIGSVGGAVVGQAYLNVDAGLYFRNAETLLAAKDVFGGLLKALVFAVTISTIACSQGMRAEHGAEGVGTATMRTVVYSFTYILMFDYLIGWALY